MLESLRDFIAAVERSERARLGNEEYENRRGYTVGILLEGHGVWRGRWHEVHQRDRVIVLYLPGSKCLHCGEVVE